MYLAMFGSALIGCGQHLLQLTWIPQTEPPAATFANRNMAAQYVSMVLPAALPLLYLFPKRKFRILVISGAVISTLYLCLAGSRAAWLSCFSAFLFIAWGGFREYRFPPSMLSMVGRSLGVAAVLFLIAVSPLNPVRSVWLQKIREFSTPLFIHELPSRAADSRGRMLSRAEGTEHSPRGAMDAVGKRGGMISRDTLGLRLTLWKNGFAMIKERPVSGFGSGHFKVFYPAFHRRAEIDRSFSETLQGKTAHNDFIQVGAELGIIGLLLLIGIPTASMVTAVRLLLSNSSRRIRLIALGTSGGVIAFMVQAMFSSPLYRALPPLILFTHAGILSVLHRGRFSSCRRFTFEIPAGAGRMVCFVTAACSLLLPVFNAGRMAGDRSYNLALLCESRGEWEGTVHHALASLRWNPLFKKTLLTAGRGAMESKDYTGAVKHLSTALNSYPRDINALVNLGVAQYGKGDGEAAMKTFLDVIRIKPDHLRALTNMGKIHMAEGEFESAAFSYEKAERIAPANPVIQLNLGYLKARTGRYRQAAAHYERLLKYRPKTAGAHRTLAFIYGRYLHLSGKSAFHMQKYIECRPGDPLSRRFKRVLESRNAH